MTKVILILSFDEAIHIFEQTYEVKFRCPTCAKINAKMAEAINEHKRILHSPTSQR